MQWKGMVGLFLIVGGFILTIVAMATLNWVAFENNSVTYGFGLVQYQQCIDSSCNTESISGLRDGGFGDTGLTTKDGLVEGGKRVIGCGIASLFCAVAGAIFLALAYRKLQNKWRLFAVIAFLCAGTLAILAVVLYSRKTVRLDYGFILYLFAAFGAMLGCTVILGGPGVTSVTTS
jgi:hypothetical protein